MDRCPVTATRSGPDSEARRKARAVSDRLHRLFSNGAIRLGADVADAASKPATPAPTMLTQTRRLR